MALVLVAALAIAVPTWVVTHPPRIPPPHRVPAKLAKLHQRVVPQAELPPVEPTSFVDLAPEEARAYNATVPFSAGPNPAARAFRFTGSTDERARALDCLAAAVIYEAGDDAPGERAVAQVVLNRLRHPAFPKTVCNVVFEGSERSSGCQFTFACDGALTRWKPSEAGWRRAREVATAALSGSVYRPVGYATHYHTDWVVPYWQSSLDKIAAVRTHLFFRWSGWWGTPPAFNRTASADEPFEPQLAALSDAHRTGAVMDEVRQALLDAAAQGGGEAAPTATSPDGQQASFLVTLDPRQLAEDFPIAAAKACGDRPRCSYMGWDRAAQTPKALPLAPEQIAAMSFSYYRDRTTGIEKALWNCTEFQRSDRSQCMKRQVLLTGTPAPATTPTPVPTKGPEELTGVRRGPVPAPTSSPQLSPRARPGVQGQAAPRP